MATLSIFAGNALPEAHEHQIRSFVRMLWHDEYLYSIEAPLMPARRHPRHVVLHDRHALISHARVTRDPVRHLGETLALCCLGDVLTYPAFRGKGHGTSVVAAATELIRDDPEADAAILFTDAGNEAYYGRHGWEAMPALSAVYGAPHGRDPAQGLAMLLFVSDRAKALRDRFDSATLELPGYGW
jgi:GNAT superfamily N-acetyltransferase